MNIIVIIFIVILVLLVLVLLKNTITSKFGAAPSGGTSTINNSFKLQDSFGNLLVFKNYAIGDVVSQTLNPPENYLFTLTSGNLTYNFINTSGTTVTKYILKDRTTSNSAPTYKWYQLTDYTLSTDEATNTFLKDISGNNYHCILSTVNPSPIINTVPTITVCYDETRTLTGPGYKTKNTSDNIISYNYNNQNVTSSSYTFFNEPGNPKTVVNNKCDNLLNVSTINNLGNTVVGQFLIKNGNSYFSITTSTTPTSTKTFNLNNGILTCNYINFSNGQNTVYYIYKNMYVSTTQKPSYNWFLTTKDNNVVICSDDIDRQYLTIDNVTIQGNQVFGKTYTLDGTFKLKNTTTNYFLVFQSVNLQNGYLWFFLIPDVIYYILSNNNLDPLPPSYNFYYDVTTNNFSTDQSINIKTFLPNIIKYNDNNSSTNINSLSYTFKLKNQNNTLLVFDNPSNSEPPQSYLFTFNHNNISYKYVKNGTTTTMYVNINTNPISSSSTVPADNYGNVIIYYNNNQNYFYNTRNSNIIYTPKDDNDYKYLIYDNTYDNNISNDSKQFNLTNSSNTINFTITNPSSSKPTNTELFSLNNGLLTYTYIYDPLSTNTNIIKYVYKNGISSSIPPYYKWYFKSSTNTFYTDEYTNDATTVGTQLVATFGGVSNNPLLLNYKLVFTLNYSFRLSLVNDVVRPTGYPNYSEFMLINGYIYLINSYDSNNLPNIRYDLWLQQDSVIGNTLPMPSYLLYFNSIDGSFGSTSSIGVNFLNKNGTKLLKQNLEWPLQQGPEGQKLYYDSTTIEFQLKADADRYPYSIIDADNSSPRKSSNIFNLKNGMLTYTYTKTDGTSITKNITTNFTQFKLFFYINDNSLVSNDNIPTTLIYKCYDKNQIIPPAPTDGAIKTVSGSFQIYMREFPQYSFGDTYLENGLLYWFFSGTKYYRMKESYNGELTPPNYNWFLQTDNTFITDDGTYTLLVQSTNIFYKEDHAPINDKSVNITNTNITDTITNSNENNLFKICTLLDNTHSLRINNPENSSTTKNITTFNLSNGHLTTSFKLNDGTLKTYYISHSIDFTTIEFTYHIPTYYWYYNYDNQTFITDEPGDASNNIMLQYLGSIIKKLPDNFINPPPTGSISNQPSITLFKLKAANDDIQVFTNPSGSTPSNSCIFSFNVGNNGYITYTYKDSTGKPVTMYVDYDDTINSIISNTSPPSYNDLWYLLNDDTFTSNELLKDLKDSLGNKFKKVSSDYLIPLQPDVYYGNIFNLVSSLPNPIRLIGNMYYSITINGISYNFFDFKDGYLSVTQTVGGVATIYYIYMDMSSGYENSTIYTSIIKKDNINFWYDVGNNGIVLGNVNNVYYLLDKNMAGGVRLIGNNSEFSIRTTFKFSTTNQSYENNFNDNIISYTDISNNIIYDEVGVQFRYTNGDITYTINNIIYYVYDNFIHDILRNINPPPYKWYYNSSDSTFYKIDYINIGLVGSFYLKTDNKKLYKINNTVKKPIKYYVTSNLYINGNVLDYTDPLIYTYQYNLALPPLRGYNTPSHSYLRKAKSTVMSNVLFGVLGNTFFMKLGNSDINTIDRPASFDYTLRFYYNFSNNTMVNSDNQPLYLGKNPAQILKFIPEKKISFYEGSPRVTVSDKLSCIVSNDINNNYYISYMLSNDTGFYNFLGDYLTTLSILKLNNYGELIFNDGDKDIICINPKELHKFIIERSLNIATVYYKMYINSKTSCINIDLLDYNNINIGYVGSYYKIFDDIQPLTTLPYKLYIYSGLLICEDSGGNGTLGYNFSKVLNGRLFPDIEYNVKCRAYIEKKNYQPAIDAYIIRLKYVKASVLADDNMFSKYKNSKLYLDGTTFKLKDPDNGINNITIVDWTNMLSTQNVDYYDTLGNYIDTFSIDFSHIIPTVNDYYVITFSQYIDYLERKVVLGYIYYPTSTRFTRDSDNNVNTSNDITFTWSSDNEYTHNTKQSLDIPQQLISSYNSATNTILWENDTSYNNYIKQDYINNVTVNLVLGDDGNVYITSNNEDNTVYNVLWYNIINYDDSTNKTSSCSTPMTNCIEGAISTNTDSTKSTLISDYLASNYITSNYISHVPVPKIVITDSSNNTYSNILILESANYYTSSDLQSIYSLRFNYILGVFEIYQGPYNVYKHKTWSSNINNTPDTNGYYFKLIYDGNLVIYKKTNDSLATNQPTIPKALLSTINGPYILVLHEDGNLILYNRNNEFIINFTVDPNLYISKPPINVARSDYFTGYFSKLVDLTSTYYTDVYINKENYISGSRFRVLNKSGSEIWSSPFIFNSSISYDLDYVRCYIQKNGNLVIKDNLDHEIWNTKNIWKGKPGNIGESYQPFRLVLQHDGVLCIYNVKNELTWSSNTNIINGVTNTTVNCIKYLRYSPGVSGNISTTSSTKSDLYLLNTVNSTNPVAHTINNYNITSNIIYRKSNSLSMSSGISGKYSKLIPYNYSTKDNLGNDLVIERIILDNCTKNITGDKYVLQGTTSGIIQTPYKSVPSNKLNGDYSILQSNVASPNRITSVLVTFIYQTGGVGVTYSKQENVVDNYSEFGKGFLANCYKFYTSRSSFGSSLLFITKYFDVVNDDSIIYNNYYSDANHPITNNNSKDNILLGPGKYGLYNITINNSDDIYDNTTKLLDKPSSNDITSVPDLKYFNNDYMLSYENDDYSSTSPYNNIKYIGFLTFRGWEVYDFQEIGVINKLPNDSSKLFESTWYNKYNIYNPDVSIKNNSIYMDNLCILANSTQINSNNVFLSRKVTGLNDFSFTPESTKIEPYRIYRSMFITNDGYLVMVQCNSPYGENNDDNKDTGKITITANIDYVTLYNNYLALLKYRGSNVLTDNYFKVIISKAKNTAEQYSIIEQLSGFYFLSSNIRGTDLFKVNNNINYPIHNSTYSPFKLKFTGDGYIVLYDKYNTAYWTNAGAINKLNQIDQRSCVLGLQLSSTVNNSFLLNSGNYTMKSIDQVTTISSYSLPLLTVFNKNNQTNDYLLYSIKDAKDTMGKFSIQIGGAGGSIDFPTYLKNNPFKIYLTFNGSITVSSLAYGCIYTTSFLKSVVTPLSLELYSSNGRFCIVDRNNTVLYENKTSKQNNLMLDVPETSQPVCTGDTNASTLDTYTAYCDTLPNCKIVSIDKNTNCPTFFSAPVYNDTDDYNDLLLPTDSVKPSQTVLYNRFLNKYKTYSVNNDIVLTKPFDYTTDTSFQNSYSSKTFLLPLPGVSGSPGADGIQYYYIYNILTSKYLDVNNSGTGNGTKVQQWTLNNNDNQKWYFKLLAGTTYYQICSKLKRGNTILCLDVYKYSKNDNGDIKLWESIGGDNQLFQKIVNGSDASIVLFKNKYSDMYIDLTTNEGLYGSTDIDPKAATDGRGIVQHIFTNQNRQIWKLVPTN